MREGEEGRGRRRNAEFGADVLLLRLTLKGENEKKKKERQKRLPSQSCPPVPYLNELS